MLAYCCGFNGYTQISADDTFIVTTPLQNVPLDDIQDIDFSWNCAVVVTGSDVYISGFCGDKSSFLKKLMKPVQGIQFLKVACAETYALFIAENGECWQYLYESENWKKLLNFTTVEGESDVNRETSDSNINKYVWDGEHVKEKHMKSKIMKICCGEVMNVALDSSGQVYSIPSPVPLPGIGVIEVACGFEHCLMLAETGSVFSWGNGMRGQLGCDMLESVEIPQEIEALGGLQVAHIAAGGWHSAAVTVNGDLYMWGWNNSGQLGFPTVDSFDSTSTGSKNRQTSIHGKENLLDPLVNMSALSCDEEKQKGKKNTIEESEEVGISARENKKVKLSTMEELNFEIVDKSSWSENDVEMKIVDDSKHNYIVSKKIVEINEVPQTQNSRVVTTDDIYEEKYYITVLAVPRVVDFPSETDVNVVDVSCGNRHTVVLAGDGSVWGCGWNAYGQLGKSPDALVSAHSMTRLDIDTRKVKISSVRCGGWNTAFLFNE